MHPKGEFLAKGSGHFFLAQCERALRNRKMTTVPTTPAATHVVTIAGPPLPVASRNRLLAEMLAHIHAAAQHRAFIGMTVQPSRYSK